jgi:outer membrane receptor for ferrienterochelin and colicins
MKLPARRSRTACSSIYGLFALTAISGVALADAADPDSQILDRIVVTASGYSQKIELAPANITVIDQLALETKPYHGLAEALADVEGVDIGDSVDKTGAPNISMRGMPADYTLILIDGRRQNVAGNVAPNNFNATQNNFIPPLSAIERIEVIRGPMSTLYGSDAMGGVVNIITRKVARDWSATVGADYVLQEDSRFGDTYSSNLYLSGPLVGDRLGLAINGAFFERDAADISYQAIDGSQVAPNMGWNPVSYTNYNFGARLSWVVTENQDVWLDGWINRQKYDNSRGQLGTLGTGGYAPEQRYNREQATLSHTARFNFGTLDSSAMYSLTETIGRLIPPGVAGAGNPRTLENENVVIDSKLTSGIGSHTFTVGGQWWESEMIDGVALAPFKHEQWALFIEDEWRFMEPLALTVGVRRDDHSTFGGHTSPRVYLVWTANDYFTVKGGVSEGYKTPRLDQLADGIVGFGGQGTIPLIGSPHLKPETSTTTELGFYFDNRNGLRLNLTLFNNDFKDKIATGDPIPNCHFNGFQQPCMDLGPQWTRSPTFGQSVNIDKAVTRGAEVAATLPLLQNLTFDTNYTFTESEQKSGDSAGKPLTNTPKHMVNARLNWDASNRLSFYLRGEYRSKRYRSVTVGSTQTVTDQLGDYRAYSLFHVGGRFQVTPSVSLNAAVYNLLDKNFIDYRPYVSDPNTGAIAYANMYANTDDARRLWVSVNVTF